MAPFPAPSFVKPTFLHLTCSLQTGSPRHATRFGIPAEHAIATSFVLLSSSDVGGLLARLETRHTIPGKQVGDVYQGSTRCPCSSLCHLSLPNRPLHLYPNQSKASIYRQPTHPQPPTTTTMGIFTRSHNPSRKTKTTATTTTTTTTKPTLMQRLKGAHSHQTQQTSKPRTVRTPRVRKTKVARSNGVTRNGAPRRKTSIGDKVSGLMMKVKGSATHRPGEKAAGTRRMHGTDGRGSRRVY
jgi:hypothetical protein